MFLYKEIILGQQYFFSFKLKQEILHLQEYSALSAFWA